LPSLNRRYERCPACTETNLAALKRSAEVDARRIGNVHSWFERDEARHAAWGAPGVKEVDERIAIVP
jgi:osmotically-inducible protein OsmY